MSGTLEHKRAVTKAVKSLGLQTDLTARAVVLAAADSTVGNSLRDLIQLNEDDPGLKALVEEFLRGEGTGKPTSCTENTQSGSVQSNATCITSYTKFMYLMITLEMLLFIKLCLSVCCDALCAGLRCMQTGYAFDVKTY